MNSPILQTYNRAPLSFAKGQGAWLKTVDGEWYLDLGSGIAVNSLGHSNLKLIKALTKQANLLWHTSNLYSIPVQEQLAQILVNNTFADKVFFTNSGTESIECAIKMARKYYFHKGLKKKNCIVTFSGSFHGRSMAAISASKATKLTKGFGPILPGFKRMPLGDLQAIKSLNLNEVCGIMVETVQGEGGIIPCSDEFLMGLRKICNDNDILLIFDEIQSGIGRSGEFFAYQYSGVTPDIVAVAKGIGGGFPLGCCLATIKSSLGMGPGTHGSTFGGNPLACAVGIAVLKEILSTGFLTRVKKTGMRLRSHLEKLVLDYPKLFHSVRGVGLMLGLKCKVKTSTVIEAAYENSLLLVPAADNVVRILPPLNINEKELTFAMERLRKMAVDVKNKI